MCFGFDGMLIIKDDINKHQGHYDIAIISNINNSNIIMSLMILISIKDIMILLLLIFLIIFIHRLLIKNSVTLLIVLENYVINLF